MDAVTPLTIEGLMLEMMAEASRHCGTTSGRGTAHLARTGERDSSGTFN